MANTVRHLRPFQTRRRRHTSSRTISGHLKRGSRPRMASGVLRPVERNRRFVPPRRHRHRRRTRRHQRHYHGGSKGRSVRGKVSQLHTLSRGHTTFNSRRQRRGRRRPIRSNNIRVLTARRRRPHLHSRTTSGHRQPIRRRNSHNRTSGIMQRTNVGVTPRRPRRRRHRRHTRRRVLTAPIDRRLSPQHATSHPSRRKRMGRPTRHRTLQQRRLNASRSGIPSGAAALSLVTATPHRRAPTRGSLRSGRDFLLITFRHWT